MKKIVLMLAIFCLLSFALASCGHEHEWKNASCTTPKTCISCGETEGSAHGHSYVDATCTEPKTCSICNIEVGSALGHRYTTGVCDICEALDPNAKSEQLAICEDIMEDLETLELYCKAQTLCYENAWYFAIYRADDYYSYTEILSDFSNYIAIDSAYVNDAIIDYLESIGMETKQINAIAALRTNSGALGIAERAIDARWGMKGECEMLITEIVSNLKKINGKVIGNSYAEAIAEYCNVLMNYYDFAKEPTGSYNTYTSNRATFNNYCTNAKNAVLLAK